MTTKQNFTRMVVVHFRSRACKLRRMVASNCQVACSPPRAPSTVSEVVSRNRKSGYGEFGKPPLSVLPTSFGNAVNGSACTAVLTSSAADLARNFRIALARYTFTVTSLIRKSAAICLLSAPVATRETISRSRLLSEAKRSLKVEFESSFARRTPSFSMASATACNKSCSRNGLVRKSTAPAFIARTAMGMSPFPVRKIIGT
jgi:hypothetical protein